MITIEFDKRELKALEKKIEKMAAFDSNNRKAIISEARKVGDKMITIGKMTTTNEEGSSKKGA